MHSQVDQSLRDPRFRRELVSEVRQGSLSRLKPAQWLDDEIVNYYGGLLAERAEKKLKGLGEDQGSGKKIHVFNSFFYAKLDKDGYEKARLKRWTKRVSYSYSSCRLLICRCHIGRHLCSGRHFDTDQSRECTLDSCGYQSPKKAIRVLR
jgi:Ulp1 family protease